MEEALAAAFNRAPEAMREANMLSGDLAATARAARDGTLEKLELRTFNPIHFMLASPEPTAEAIVARLGDPVWVEEKYDGIRCQVHKEGERVEFYSRELRRITGQFPDLAARARKIPADFVADGELLAWQNGRALPFAELQKRLGRKGGDDFFSARRFRFRSALRPARIRWAQRFEIAAARNGARGWRKFRSFRAWRSRRSNRSAGPRRWRRPSSRRGSGETRD